MRVANEFNWTWTSDDLPAFCERTGWQLTENERGELTLATNLEVNRGDVWLSLGDGIERGAARVINRIAFRVSDVVLDRPDLRPEFDKVFDAIAQRVFEVLGQRPTRWWVDPSRGLRWDMPNLVVTTTMTVSSVYVHIISPAHQRWNDENDASLERGND
ncbi:DUF6301 family protein [Nocardia xishanensis]|uniref:DUF6301 family protein n=1 Tax=Nocardia xishanensis TaxID=238964 RepID=A0ABW7X4E0_9NOCA